MIQLNHIYNEDCLITMSRIPDEFVDFTITSPPYNLGNTHHTGNKRHQPYDDNLPEGEYQRWQIEVLEEIYRITKPTGSLIYNHKNRIRKGVSITPYIWLLQTSWIIKQGIVWFNRSQNFDKIRFYPMTERLYWLAKSPETKLFNAISHHDLFDAKEWKAEGTSKNHTRSFPLKMVQDMLLCFPDAKVIYDPFMGSGTVAVASILSGRNYIGSEISSEYCTLAESEVLGVWS